MADNDTGQNKSGDGPFAAQPNAAPNPILAQLQNLVQQGMAAVQQKQWQAGLDILSQAALISDQTPFLWEHLGLCAVNLEKFEAAYLHTTRLIWLQPDHVPAHLNRGRIASKLNMIAEAVEDFEWVLKFDKATPLNIAEAGVELISLYRDANSDKAGMKKAFDIIARLEKLPPEAIEPFKGKFYRHRIFSYLKAGDYEKGFEYYEIRNDPNVKLFSQPIWATLPHHQDGNLWRGKETLKDKTILIAAEQGFGDVIQFGRLLPDFLQLAKKQGGKKIILEVYPELVELFASSPISQGMDVVARGATPPSFDCWLRLGSLPYHLKLTMDKIPFGNKKNPAYLSPTSAGKDLLPKVAGRRKIGLAWSSNVNSNDNSLRSIPSLKTLLPLWDAEDCDFYSLQVGEKSKEIAEIGMEAAFLDLSLHIKNFADTARFIQEMDIIITIDSSVMHVAAALGKTTWVMAPYASDWRLGLGKAEQTHASPWYPTTTIFRCTKPGDWDAVIERVQQKLLDNK